jgi:hypothetical protein
LRPNKLCNIGQHEGTNSLLVLLIVMQCARLNNKHKLLLWDSKNFRIGFYLKAKPMVWFNLFLFGIEVVSLFLIFWIMLIFFKKYYFNVFLYKKYIKKKRNSYICFYMLLFEYKHISAWPHSTCSTMLWKSLSGYCLMIVTYIMYTH